MLKHASEACTLKLNEAADTFTGREQALEAGAVHKVGSPASQSVQQGRPQSDQMLARRRFVLEGDRQLDAEGDSIVSTA